MASTEPDFSAQTPSIQLGDIYYTLFRHKWKIILTSLAGIALALGFYKLVPPPYASEAKLFIRYVITENKAPGVNRDDSVTKSPDQRGETIIKSELEILTSLDLAQEVAKAIGPEKVLGQSTGSASDDLFAASVLIQGNLVVEVPPNSSVIRLAFYHSNPVTAQVVLKELVASYLKKHREIHRAAGMVNDFLNQETDQLRRRLSDTENELRKATNTAGIISLEDSKKSFGEQIARIRQQIFDAQAELAERTSIMQDLTRGTSSTAPTAEAQPGVVPPEQINAYQKVATRLALLVKREQEYLGFFTEESSRVREVRAQITEIEDQKKKMETEFPGLTRVQVATAATVNQPANANAFDPVTAGAQIAALQAKIKTLNAQLAEVRTEATRMDGQETSILELRRRKELEEANYRYYAASLEQSRINEALGTGRVSNISEIEKPTPALKDSKKTKKIMMGIAGAGIALGFAWAFLIELYLDRSIRRPADIERTLRLPLFLSIPRLKGLTGPGVSSLKHTPLLPGPGGTSAAAGAGSASLQLATLPTESQLALNPFYETLRDRLINYFDTLNVRHKPKLVAVTGLGKDSGVTTIAAGLARSFSETGEGNVLLVDMTQGQGSAQHFHKGATVVGLEQLLDTKQSAQVQDHLYVVSENSNSDRLAKGMPQRFNQLIPKLKASDFDYIIFDMPPVNQISVTPRLAGFMDMMLLVVESEKTDRDIALHASAMLAKSKAPVGVVLNKTKTYIPPGLHQDRESLLGG